MSHRAPSVILSPPNDILSEAKDLNGLAKRRNTTESTTATTFTSYVRFSDLTPTESECVIKRRNPPRA